MDGMRALGARLLQTLASEGRLSAPPWVIAVFGTALVLGGLTYFALRARRGSPAPPR
jgi:hypothetical protein